MTNWDSNGHLSELALEMWAAGEPETHELQAFDSHLRLCPACRARAAEWRGLFLVLSSLQGVEPSKSFSSKVMKQVRVPVYAPAGMPAWVAKVAHRAPRVAAAVIGAWTLALVGSVAWLQNRVEVPASLLVARYLSNVEELLLAAALKVAAVLHVSGFADWWSQTTGSVPGLGVAGALALMVGISGLAIWTLYRVTGYQPGRVEHA